MFYSIPMGCSCPPPKLANIYQTGATYITKLTDVNGLHFLKKPAGYSRLTTDSGDSHDDIYTNYNLIWYLSMG
ncbi:hypothetical protein BJM06_a00047 (plasmid) [Enterobacter cloacae]|nr:hypothetical protein BJM06_a00047 [Enterobacter cloacae]